MARKKNTAQKKNGKERIRILDPDQSEYLARLIDAAHPYPAAEPCRWTKPDGATAKEIFPKPVIRTIPGDEGYDVEDPDDCSSDHDDDPKEEPHTYHLLLNEVEYIDYPGVYKGFRGIDLTIQRVIRIPYLFYKSTGQGQAILVKDFIMIMYEGGAGH